MALPADFFTCPPLSEDEVEAYTRLAERTARELVQYGNVERGPIKWKSHTTEPNLLVYEGFDTRGPSNERVWCAISEIQASIEEVQMMTYAETSADYKLFTQKFFGDILDAARLYNIVEPTAERPLHFVGINWVLQKSPGRGLIRNRDYNKLLPPESRNQCAVCDKPFSKSKKLNCRKCGQVVCRHCSKIYELKVNNHWGELRVCEPCVFGKVSETRGSLATI
ncbi:unnamed protein product [Aphanomyces euteiches]